VDDAMARLRGRLKTLASVPAPPPAPPVPQMGFTLGDVSHSEGNSGTTTYQYTVTRSVVSAGAATVDWAVTGTGTNPANAADFGGTFPSGTVSFADGEASKTFDVLVTGDATVEMDETFLVTLSNPSSGIILQATAIGTIVNDDSPSAPQPITMPDLPALTDLSSVTGAATGWVNGAYDLGSGITMTVSAETYTLSGAPF